MKKIIIEIRDNIPEIEAVDMVQQVIKEGRISKARGLAQYSFVSTFSVLPEKIYKYRVIARQKTNINTDSFIVEKEYLNDN